MGISMPTLAAARNYTNLVAAGLTSIRVDGDRVYFTLAATGEEVYITVPTVPGPEGTSIVDVAINDEGHLICTLSDGTEIDAGQAEGIDELTNDQMTDLLNLI